MRQLFAALAALLLFAGQSVAQTDPAAGATPAKKKAAPKKKATGKRKAKKPAPAPAPAPEQKPPESAAQAAPATPAPVEEPAKAPPPKAAAVAEPEVPTVPGDEEPPAIEHTPVARTLKGKAFTIAAHITDPSGVFQPVVYLRKKGMGAAEYIPLKMVASKGAPGDYAVDVAALLATVDLEYYLETYDYAGNGPARAGSPEAPLQIAVYEEQKKIIVAPKAPEPVAPPPTVTVKPKGAPPSITHSAVARATKGQPIEINARLSGDTGVDRATVMFRHVGEKEFRALPMGNIGADDYTATIPASQATSDLEYYLEAWDKYGNGPARTGSPTAPFVAKVAEPAPAAPAPLSAGANQPRLVKGPFQPNPGRAVAWTLMAGFVGAGVFAGGEAIGAWQAHNAYTQAFTHQGLDRADLLDKANAYGKRAKIAGIVAGASLVTSIVLLLVFPEHPDTLMVGGGGDVGVRF